MPNEERLPSWARSELNRLRQNVAYLKEQVANMVKGSGSPTDTYMERHDMPEIGLPRGSRVRFQGLEGSVTVFVDEGEIVAQAGCERLVVVPRAANMVFLRVEAWRAKAALGTWEGQ